MGSSKERKFKTKYQYIGNFRYELSAEEGYYYTFAKDPEFLTAPYKVLMEKYNCSNNLIMKYKKLLKSKDNELIFNTLYKRELSVKEKHFKN